MDTHDGRALQPVYDRIGIGYSGRRRPEPSWEAQITAALRGARSILNVGAGTGSWHERNGHLLRDDRADHGYRLVVARNERSPTR